MTMSKADAMIIDTPLQNIFFFISTFLFAFEIPLKTKM